jgi:hypothetical protein
MAPVGKTRTIEPPRSSRTVERDLATGRWVERLVEDHGLCHIEAIDLDVGEGMTCEFSIMDDDPLSASAVWNWHSVRRRAGWDIEIRTTTRLSATATEFLIDTDVEALEDSKGIFSRSWNERLPRDGV